MCCKVTEVRCRALCHGLNDLSWGEKRHHCTQSLKGMLSRHFRTKNLRLLQNNLPRLLLLVGRISVFPQNSFLGWANHRLVAAPKGRSLPIRTRKPAPGRDRLLPRKWLSRLQQGSMRRHLTLSPLLHTHQEAPQSPLSLVRNAHGYVLFGQSRKGGHSELPVCNSLAPSHCQPTRPIQPGRNLKPGPKEPILPIRRC